jgi:hypothetical protein
MRRWKFWEKCLSDSGNQFWRKPIEEIQGTLFLDWLQGKVIDHKKGKRNVFPVRELNPGLSLERAIS